MKKKIVAGILGAGLMLGITGCGNKTRVPSGTEGKILTSNGFAPEILQPGAYHVCSIATNP